MLLYGRRHDCRLLNIRWCVIPISSTPNHIMMTHYLYSIIENQQVCIRLKKIWLRHNELYYKSLFTLLIRFIFSLIMSNSPLLVLHSIWLTNLLSTFNDGGSKNICSSAFQDHCPLYGLVFESVLSSLTSKCIILSRPVTYYVNMFFQWLVLSYRKIPGAV